MERASFSPLAIILLQNHSSRIHTRPGPPSTCRNSCPPVAVAPQPLLTTASHKTVPHNCSSQLFLTNDPHNCFSQLLFTTTPHNCSPQLLLTTASYSTTGLTSAVHIANHNYFSQLFISAIPHNCSLQQLLTPAPQNCFLQLIQTAVSHIPHNRFSQLLLTSTPHNYS
jgi:hypothetical protein